MTAACDHPGDLNECSDGKRCGTCNGLIFPSRERGDMAHILMFEYTPDRPDVVPGCDGCDYHARVFTGYRRAPASDRRNELLRAALRAWEAHYEAAHSGRADS